MTGPSAMPQTVVRVVALGLAFAAGAWMFSGDPAPRPTAAQTAEAAADWTCSMHPSVHANAPGDCPLCGMDLVLAGSGSTAGADQVVLSERARALAKLRTTAVVRQGDAAAEIRLLGRVEPDESTRRNVTTWMGGRIDRLWVNTTGEQVRKGQVIATLYSPEVYAAHQDLLTAQGQVARLTDTTPSTVAAAEAAVLAAKERLALLGVPAAELEEMARAGEPTRSVKIRSPFSGTVIERVATEGAYVETGAALYRVADLSRLWVQLDAYEADLGQISVGQAVQVTVDGLAQTVEGKVAFIDPTLDAQRRTARVRVAVRNPDGLLRPGLFATAVVLSKAAPASGAPLVVPASAPLFTGKRSVVYVEQQTADSLAYVPRTVRLGPRLGEVYPVVAGLSEGERVVSRGAFAIDADLQIRGGPSMMSTSPADAVEAAVPTVALAPDARASLAPVVEGYLGVQRALAEDDHGATVGGAEALSEALGAVVLGDAAREAWQPVHEALARHSQQVAGSSSLEGARLAFEPLSAAVQALLRQFGNPTPRTLHLAYCPMAQGDAGAEWVQEGRTIDNAYFGASMRRCGEIRAEVAAGDVLAALPGAPAATGHQGHDH